MSTLDATGLPWYRHFWPWFIIGLLATSMGASIAMVVIAFTYPDPMVSEAYYAEGTAINERLARERVAVERGLSAQLVFDAENGVLEVALSGDDASTLVLALRHPTRPDRDQQIEFVRDADGRYRATLSEDLRGAWYASLEPVVPEATRSTPSWRIARSIYLMAGQVEALAPRDPRVPATGADG